MKRFAVQLDQLAPDRWAWLLDFVLAGLAFEHAFDLLLSPDAEAAIANDDPQAERYRKQLDALRHHGLGEVLTLAPGETPPVQYHHVFRF